MPEPLSWRRAASAGLGSIMAVAVLAGCGAAGFDPIESEPCEFFTDEELEDYRLDPIPEVGEGDTACYFMKRDIATGTLTSVHVVYLSEPTDTVAERLDMTAVKEPDGGVTHKGVKGETSRGAGTCRLLAPIDTERSMLVEIEVDAGGINWSGSGKTFQPCAFVTERYDDIQSRINS